MKTRFLSAALAAMLIPAAQAQIAVGGATPTSDGATFLARIEQNIPGLTQVRNGNASTIRRELGPVMGFCGGSNNGTSATYTSPLDGFVNNWSENDSWAYDGEMFMEGGTNYTFASLIDDFATIKIDGNLVLSQTSCQFTSGSYLCESSGWHRISIRVWDTGGGYGNNRNFTPGIAYNTKGKTSQNPVALWTRLVDPGDGSLFRTTVTNSGIRVVAQMRENDPTIMDVDYIVYSDSPTVNVRALAFENGDRGFATVVRPETFVEGTENNKGDGITANVAHRISWKVSSDWNTDLAKVRFEILAMKPGDLLLPIHFLTIPAAEGHLKTIVGINPLLGNGYWGGKANPSVLSALLWCYADARTDISLSNGILSTIDDLPFSLTGATWNGVYEDDLLPDKRLLIAHDSVDYEAFECRGCDWYDGCRNALVYLFGVMGFRRLEGTEMTWVNENTRLGLELSYDWDQYPVKTVEE